MAEQLVVLARRYPRFVGSGVGAVAIILTLAVAMSVLYRQAKHESTKALASLRLFEEALSPGEASLPATSFTVAQALDQVAKRLRASPDLPADVRAHAHNVIARHYAKAGMWQKSAGEAWAAEEQILKLDDPLHPELAYVLTARGNLGNPFDVLAVDVKAAVPAVSGWGMVVMALAFLAAATMLLRRRLPHVQPLAAIVLSVCVLCSNSNATTLADNFEDDTVGNLPGAPWRDITVRINSPTVVSPTGSVVSTMGPDGQTTKAYRIFENIGTSSGIVADIDLSDIHHLAADIRVDSQARPIVLLNFNAAMSLLQDSPVADFNNGPQATVFASFGRWFLYVHNVGGQANSINVQLSPVPIVFGAWYHVELVADTTSGSFDIRITSDAAGFSVQRTIQFPGWRRAFGRYDAISFYDGEYFAGTTTGGQFTVDNVVYGMPSVPTLGEWGVAVMMLLLVVSATLVLRRRRPHLGAFLAEAATLPGLCSSSRRRLES